MTTNAEIAKLRRYRKRLAISIPAETFFAALFTLVLFGLSKLVFIPTWLMLVPAITLAFATVMHVISFFYWGYEMRQLQRESPKENPNPTT
jgi:hypothetical protein